MATDFRSQRIRTNALIASRSDAGNPGMIIYSGSGATNFEGGISDSNLLNGVGTDTFLFVSGTITDDVHMRRGSPKSAVTLFGGDLVVSGTLYAERQVVEVDEVATGSLLLSGALFVSRSLSVGENISLDVGQHGGPQIGYLNFSNVSGDTGFGFRTNEGTMEFKNSGGNWEVFGSGGGSMSNFILAGDGGINPQTIEDGNTASIVGGIGITTLSSATDTLTVSLDYLGSDNAILAAGSATPVAGDSIWFSDADDSTIKRSLVSDLPFGNMSNFTIADTSTNTSTITNGDTLTFTNTANETTVGVSGDNVTIGLSATGVNAGSYTSADITVDANGRITSATNGGGGGTMSSWDITGDTGTPEQVIDGKEVYIAGGTGIGSVVSSTRTVTISIDYSGTDNFIDSATNLEGTPISSSDTIVYHDADDNDVKKGLVSDLPFGEMTSFNLAADSGSQETILNSEVLRIKGNPAGAGSGEGGIKTELIGSNAGNNRVDLSLKYEGSDNFILTAEDGTGITIDSSNDHLLVSDGTDGKVKYIQASQISSGGGTMSSFNFRGDSGGTTTIGDGDTTRISGGTAITSDNSAGTVTVALDLGELNTSVTNSDADYFVTTTGNSAGAGQNLIARADIDAWFGFTQDGNQMTVSMDPDSVSFRGEGGIQTTIPSVDTVKFAATGSYIGTVKRFDLTGENLYSYLSYPLSAQSISSGYWSYTNMAGLANGKLGTSPLDWQVTSDGDGTVMTDRPQYAAALKISSAPGESVNGLIIQATPPARWGNNQINNLNPGDQAFRLRVHYYVPAAWNSSNVVQAGYFGQDVDLRICGRVLRTATGSGVKGHTYLFNDQLNAQNQELSDNQTPIPGGWCDQTNSNLDQNSTPGWASWQTGPAPLTMETAGTPSVPASYGFKHAQWSQPMRLVDVVNSDDVGTLQWDDKFQFAIARNRDNQNAQPLNQNTATGAIDTYDGAFYILGVDIEWLEV